MRFKKILKYLTIVEIAILVVVASYSWFADKSNPSISENSIKVSSAEGLSISLLPDSEARSSVNLNQIMAHFGDFELKQISSATAETFYYVDFGQGLSQGNPRFLASALNTYGEVDMIKYGYIDYNFYLQTEDFGKHVYLHKDTAINGVAANALRLAITVGNNTSSVTRIFGSAEENGITNPFTTKAVIAPGTFIFNNIDPALVGNQVVTLISSRNGGRGISDSAPIDLAKILISIPANSQARINVKIWLEGGDVDCTSTIASSLLDVLIKFGSANILLPAPTVTPNQVTHVVTGLTTSMQYASTNTQSTVWTNVTNAAMVFTTPQTVYIRIAPIAGVSPESYATTVVFN